MLAAILVFGILIFSHELGHYLAARWAGVTVLEFSIGMGPAIYRWEKEGTDYSLRLLPIGGYVRMEGEEGDPFGDSSPRPVITRSFREVSVGKRAVIVSAGAAMNLLLAFLIMIGLVTSFRAVGSTTVARFEENSLSAQTGLEAGDQILEINGRRIRITIDTVYALYHSGGAPCEVTVLRNGERQVLRKVSFPLDESGVPRLDFYFQRAPFHPGTILHEALFRCITLTREIYSSLGEIFTGGLSIRDLSGPVGTTKVISEVSRQGLASLANFVVFMSINLGIINLLPIPSLDGGRLFLLLIEKLRGRPLPAEVEGGVNLIGFALLMLLVMLVTWQDIKTLLAR
ncbi:MAG: site-2 protease family protein [Clostridia bacterium]|nr:site-2 protease family protein [Clostridia bacterium]